MNFGVAFSSLSEQVYTYLRQEMNIGNLLPGAFFNMSKIAEELGISCAPLRDALKQLEFEGYITIVPRCGVRVNELQEKDIKNIYQAIGLVESFIIKEYIAAISPNIIRTLERLNEEMITYLEAQSYEKLSHTHFQFHQTYLDISDNDLLKNFVNRLKGRLNETPNLKINAEWERKKCREHSGFIDYLKQGRGDDAAKLLTEVHWCFNHQRKYIVDSYGLEMSI